MGEARAFRSLSVLGHGVEREYIYSLEKVPEPGLSVDHGHGWVLLPFM